MTYFLLHSAVQVVHDFTDSAIALKRHFGDAVKIGRAFDTQFALEVLQGNIRGTVGSAIKAFTGEHDLFSDVAYRCAGCSLRKKGSIMYSIMKQNTKGRNQEESIIYEYIA